MKKADDYHQNAQRCRALAAKMEDPEVRDQLLAMANTWDDMAEERLKFIAAYPEFKITI